MEGKGIVLSNVRSLGRQINHATNDHSKTYGLIRRNGREAWKLERSYQEIEGKKNHLKNAVERMENDLIIEADKMQRTSGSLICNKNIAKDGLPTVIISPATTRRSKLPWEKHVKAPLTRQTSLPCVSKEITAKGNSSQSCNTSPSLPRLQTAMGDSHNNSGNFSMYCRKVRQEHKNLENIDDLVKSAAKDSKESSPNLLQIPSPKQDKSVKAVFQLTEKEKRRTQSESKVRVSELQMEMPKKKPIGRRATISL